MVAPNRMTKYQKIVTGLRIFEAYLSPKNQGDIATEHDVIYATGVHRDALGGDDRAKLKAMGWEWNASFAAWEFTL